MARKKQKQEAPTIISHIRAPQIIGANVFTGCRSMGDLVRSIVKYGNEATVDALTEEGKKEGADTYQNRVGWAWEVWLEWFLRFGLKGHPAFGVTDIQDTSQNQFNGGFDFTARDMEGNLVLIQAKFHGDPTATHTRRGLGTFVSWADELGVPASRRWLVTNLKHAPVNGIGGIFHSSYAGGAKQMRVIGLIEIEAIVDRDPRFWDGFNA